MCFFSQNLNLVTIVCFYVQSNKCRGDCITGGCYKLCHQENNSSVVANQETETTSTCVLPKYPGKVNSIRGLLVCLTCV